MARDDFMMFCLHTDGKYRPNWHHEVIADALMAVERGEIDRLLLTIPPRHGKSELASIKFPSWFLGKHPDSCIITASYSADLAVSFGRKSRNLLNAQDVFAVKLADDSKSAGMWNTNKGGEYTATGVGGGITGKGAKIFLIDDPFKNREEAESEVIRDKVWDWYTSTAYTRLEDKGAIILIQTRWHSADLAGRILADNKDGFVHINLPAIAENDEKFRKEGEPLWESKYTIEDLLRIKSNIGIYDWSALYQQQPTNREAQEFKDEWFKVGNAPGGCLIFTVVDPAISKKDKACNSVVMTCAVSHLNDIYILEYTRAKLDPSELINEIWRHAITYEPYKIGIETIAYQQAVKHYFEVKQNEEKRWFTIEELRTKSEKDGRIRGLIPYYKNGKIFHNVFCSELEEELVKFPNGKLIDTADALSLVLDILAIPDTPVEKIFNPYENDPTAPWNKKKEKFNYNSFISN